MLKTVIDGQSKITIPQDILSQLHLSSGDEFHIEIDDGNIILKPGADGLDSSDIEASITRGLQDVAEGRTYGPFKNANNLIRSLKTIAYLNA